MIPQLLALGHASCCVPFWAHRQLRLHRALTPLESSAFQALDRGPTHPLLQPADTATTTTTHMATTPTTHMEATTTVIMEVTTGATAGVDITTGDGASEHLQCRAPGAQAMPACRTVDSGKFELPVWNAIQLFSCAHTELC